MTMKQFERAVDKTKVGKDKKFHHCIANSSSLSA
jgi:hypothetical protein